MDKKFLLRANDSFKQIKTQLLLNDTIRKYLYYDNIDDNTEAPVIDIVKDFVFIQPVITVETTEPFNKKNYITITLPDGKLKSNKMEYVLRIIVMSDKSSWNINDDARPLILSQEIVNTLDGFKTYFSNELKFVSMVETVTTKDVYGYSLLFSATDGISEVNDK